MRALRVVGITEGGGEFSVVLEDPARRERFTVPADEQLRAAARGDLTRLGQISIELESQLRPREIQARIRAGASVEQVAAAAGVPVQKIERFAYPVLLERSRTAEVAQRAHPMRADGPDTRTLGDVVAHTFGLRGQDYADAEWDSWKGEDGKWIVALSWHAGRSDNRAHWTFQPGAHGGTVTAVDEHASDLVEGLPARPLRTVGPVIDISRTEDPVPTPAPGREEERRAVGADPVRGARIDPPRETAEARTVVERTPQRPAPEQRRPVPPTQRQAPVEPPRTDTTRPEPARPDRGRTQPEAGARPDRDARPRRGPDEETATARPDAPETRTAGAGDEPTREPAGRTEPAARTEPEVRSEPAAPAARTEERRPEPAAPAPRTEERRPEPAAPAPRTEERRPEPVPGEVAAAGEPAAPEQPAAASAEETAAETAPRAPETPAASPQPAANRRTKKGKPVMPSWDEVLLGVRGQR